MDEMWAGPKKHFLVFPVRHGTMVNYVGFVPTDEQMKESWSAPGDPQALREMLAKKSSGLGGRNLQESHQSRSITVGGNFQRASSGYERSFGGRGTAGQGD